MKVLDEPVMRESREAPSNKPEFELRLAMLETAWLSGKQPGKEDRDAFNNI